jgi:pimeloyl-ACP methyl ester carboxylesterase
MLELLATFFLAAAVPAVSDPVEAPRECVVLLHGLGRGPGSMRPIERRLEATGYLVWNGGYPSRSASVADLAERYIPQALEDCRQRGAARVHFVTHSLGGILLRQYLHTHAMPDVGRVVMLSPPNGGSEVADHLAGWALYQWIMGPAGGQLGTGEGSIVRSFGAFPAECGVVTGSSSLDPWFSPWLPAPHDGKVSVASAKLDGMRDFLVVPRAHGLIMRDGDVISQVLHFLANGRFSHEGESRS